MHVIFPEYQIKSNQITFIVTSPQHKCLGEWNSYERAPDSAKKKYILHTDSTYLQNKTFHIKYINIAHKRKLWLNL